MTRRISLLSAASVLVPMLALSSGCEFIDQLTQHTGIVDVFTTSQGSPDEQGNMPNRNGKQLVFTNDMGWQVFVNQAYVTTAGVTLESCDGEQFDVEMYWGALAENLGETADADVSGIGGVRANSGTYCEATVAYAPAEDADDAVAMGATVYFSGSAVKGDQHIDFTWRSEVSVDAKVDLSKAELGKPFQIKEQQYVSKKLTISKAYNHFFDGVDFAEEISQQDIDDLVSDSLRATTIAFEGTSL
jgi:hypothetical protein